MIPGHQGFAMMNIFRRAVRGVCLTILQMEDGVKNLQRRLWQDERGQDLVEYALSLVLIALGAAAIIQTLGGQ